MVVNHEVYMDVGLNAHAATHLRIVCGVPKWVAKQAWTQAKAEIPLYFGPMTCDEHRAQLAYAFIGPETRVLHVARRMARRWQLHPLLLHRDLLQAVEARQQQAHEQNPEQRTGHVFSLFPLRRIRMSHVAVDTKTMLVWAKRNPALVPPDIAEDKLIETFFLPRHGWSPGRQISTDGVKVSLTYTKRVPKRVVGQETTRAAKRRRRDVPGQAIAPTAVDIARAPKGMYCLDEIHPGGLDSIAWEAFDPGLTTLYTGSEGTAMSRCGWRHLTGANDAVRAANRRDLKIAHVLARLSHATLKSCDPTVLTQHLARWIASWHVLWRHYGARYWGHQRFKAFIRHQRVLAKIANDVLGKDRRKVAVFGNGVYPASVKGIPPAPVTKVRDFLARHGCVVLVDEYRTSRTCSRCHHRMTRDARVHLTMHCNARNDDRTLAGCAWSWNRDVNAAANIAHLFKEHMAGHARPAYLQRSAGS